MSGRTLVNVNGYTVDDDVTLSDDLFNIATGATLVLLGTDTLNDDAIEGSGRVSIRGPATLANSLTLSGDALFVNMSSIDEGFGVLTLGQSASDAPTIRNIASATWTLDDSADIFGNAHAEFVNLGLLETVTNGFSSIDANFYDRGGRIVADGQLEFDTAGSVGRFINDHIEGSGVFVLNGGVLVGSDISTASVDLVVARTVGDVTISSATLSTGLGSFVPGDLNLGAGSVLSLTGADAKVTFNNEIIGAGTIEVRGDDSVALGRTLTFVGDVALDNFADTTFALVPPRSGGHFGPPPADDLIFATKPWLDDQIVLENQAGARWTDVGDDTVFEQIGGPGASVFINNGVFQENSSGGATFDIAVANDDLMTTSGGALVFNDGVIGAGQIDVGVANVTFAGSVASGQTLSFNATPSGADTPTLTIESPQSFAGLIAGFGADEQLVFDTGTWQYQDFVPGDGGGALMFSNGSAETAVNLVGAYQATGFHAAVSGDQTTITYSV